MRLTIFISLILAGTLTVSGQNQLDDQGRKSGHWKVDDPKGKTLYEADFVEGRPVGEMIRYYKSGAVRAKMMFDSTGDRSYVRMFYPNRKIAAEGRYFKQQKDSVWTYYSNSDGSVRIREPYKNGFLQGMVHNYYTSGQVSDEVDWAYDLKQGNWKQYYLTGAPRLSAHYRDDLLHGSYEVYFANGNLKVKGDFLEGRSNGFWSYHDETGAELISLEFLNGIPVDRERYDQWIQDTLEKYQAPIAPESFQNFQ